jgi:glutathione S-transferase
MAAYTLVVGNKNLSSWSLRPWLALKTIGVPFEEIVVRLDQPETRASIKDHSPAGKVPILKIAEGSRSTIVWDSLAICETLAERHPDAKLWPDDPFLRARARSYAAEMHSGFPDVRQELPMDFARTLDTPDLSEGAQTQVRRIIESWTQALSENPGGFLFGRFSIADCMYAPVVSRFMTYGIALPGTVQSYCSRMMELPAMRDWRTAAEAEIARGWK